MHTSHAPMTPDLAPMQYEAEAALTRPGLANVRSIDWRELESEDPVGCARGVVWAIVFEFALVIAAVVYWKLSHLPH